MCLLVSLLHRRVTSLKQKHGWVHLYIGRGGRRFSLAWLGEPR